jgi:hypothetical protein
MIYWNILFKNIFYSINEVRQKMHHFLKNYFIVISKSFLFSMIKNNWYDTLREHVSELCSRYYTKDVEGYKSCCDEIILSYYPHETVALWTVPVKSVNMHTTWKKFRIKSTVPNFSLHFKEPANTILK